MNKDLKQLVEISQIDKESDALEPMIKEANKALDELLVSQHNIENNLSIIKEIKQEYKLAISKNELIIQENTQKIEEINKKLKEVRSDRESKALAIEEDLTKEQIKHADNEIKRLNKELDSKINEEKEYIRELEKIQDKVETTKQATELEIKKIKIKQQEIFAKKDKYNSSIDKRVIRFYEKIRKWAKTTSIVPIKKQACGGCFIRISDRLYADLLESNDIITCPHCGRILYIEENV